MTDRSEVHPHGPLLESRNALWIFKIYADSSGVSKLDEPMTKKYVQEVPEVLKVPYWYTTHEKIINDILTKADWNREGSYSLEKSQIAITYYNEQFKEHVDAFLSDEAIPGIKYYVMLGSVPGSSESVGKGVREKNSLLNGPD